jgi:hypothetical protein
LPELFVGRKVSVVDKKRLKRTFPGSFQMFKSIARLGAAFVTAITLSAPAAASTYSIDYTDLWGGGQPAPTENGWGLNLVQQGDVIFATMFVYGTDNTARWFSATLTGGPASWSGALDQTTGSYYGTTWSNSSVTHNAVGTMSVGFSSTNAGTLTYSVGGVQVTKQISRFTFRTPNLAGHYLGGATATCSNGTGVLIFDTLSISQSGVAVAMQVDFFNGQGTQSRCTFNGTINTTGRTGTITGNYNCTFGSTAGNAGTFTVSNLESSITGFNGSFSGSDQFCTGGMNGYFGGVKDVQ